MFTMVNALCSLYLIIINRHFHFKKMSKEAFIIRITNQIFIANTLLQAYHSFIVPYLTFGVIICEIITFMKLKMKVNLIS